MFPKNILVVNRSSLFKNGYVNGFTLRKESKIKYEEMLLDEGNYKWMNRYDADKNPGVKQPIPYFMIINPNLKSILIYTRSKCNVPELQGKMSLCIGGHIIKEDIDGTLSLKDCLDSCIERELKSQIEIKGNYRISDEVIGYINIERGIQRGHSGFLGLIITDAEEKDIKIKDKKIESLELVKISNLENKIKSSNPEEWSRVVFEEYLLKKKFLRKLDKTYIL